MKKGIIAIFFWFISLCPMQNRGEFKKSEEDCTHHFLTIPPELICTFFQNQPDFKTICRTILSFKYSCKKIQQLLENPILENYLAQRLSSEFSQELPQITSLEQKEIIKILLNNTNSSTTFKNKLANRGNFLKLCEEIRVNLPKSIPLLVACKKAGVDLNTITVNFDDGKSQSLITYSSLNADINASLLDRLLSQGFSAQSKDKSLESIIFGKSVMVTMYNNEDEVNNKIKCLLKHGARDQSAFNYCVVMENSDLVSLLLQYKVADPNCVMSGSYTPLTFLVSTSSDPEKESTLKLIEELLKYGADPELKGDSGECALEIAREENYTKLENLFQRYLKIKK